MGYFPIYRSNGFHLARSSSNGFNAPDLPLVGVPLGISKSDRLGMNLASQWLTACWSTCVNDYHSMPFNIILITRNALSLALWSSSGLCGSRWERFAFICIAQIIHQCLTIRCLWWNVHLLFNYLAGLCWMRMIIDIFYLPDNQGILLLFHVEQIEF